MSAARGRLAGRRAGRRGPGDEARPGRDSRRGAGGEGVGGGSKEQSGERGADEKGRGEEIWMRGAGMEVTDPRDEFDGLRRGDAPRHISREAWNGCGFWRSEKWNWFRKAVKAGMARSLATMEDWYEVE